MWGVVAVQAGMVGTMLAAPVIHVGVGPETWGHARQGVRMRPLSEADILGGPHPQGEYGSGKKMCPLAQPDNKKLGLSLLGLRGKNPPPGNKNSGPVSHIDLSLSLYYPEV